MDNKKVYVTQFYKNLNFAKAQEYGDVVFLTDKEYRPEPTMPRYNEQITSEIERKFSSYVPGHDYIITTGSAIPNVVVGSLLAKMPGTHNILKWSSRNEMYELFKVRI